MVPAASFQLAWHMLSLREEWTQTVLRKSSSVVLPTTPARFVTCLGFIVSNAHSNSFWRYFHGQNYACVRSMH